MRLLVVALTLVVSANATAATLYVATDGSDAKGDGSAGVPFATITRAAAAARPGDTVVVRGGVYRQRVSIWTNGTAAARIAVQPHGGENVIIDGSGPAGDTVTIAGNYIDFTGFEIRNSTRVGLVVWGAHHVRVRNNTVRGSHRSGIWVGHSRRGRVYEVLVEGNRVFDNVRENRGGTWSGGWGQSIGVSNADRVTVAVNTVYGNYGEGILIGASKDCVVRANEVFDNYSVQIYLTYAQRTRIEGNFTYSTGDRRFYRTGHPASGIMLANETPRSTDHATRENVIVNNVVLRSRWGIAYWRRTGHGMKDTVIAHNTVYDATEHLLNIDADAAHRGNTVENNIFATRSGTTIEVADVAERGTTYRNNHWPVQPEGHARGAGDRIGDPRFVRGGGSRPEDYRLTAPSPCKDAGRRTVATDRDYTGAVRSDGAPDMGAFEIR